MLHKYNSEVKMSELPSLPGVYDKGEFQGDTREERKKLKVLGNMTGTASSHWQHVL